MITPYYISAIHILASRKQVVRVAMVSHFVVERNAVHLSAHVTSIICNLTYDLWVFKDLGCFERLNPRGLEHCESELECYLWI